MSPKPWSRRTMMTGVLASGLAGVVARADEPPKLRYTPAAPRPVQGTPPAPGIRRLDPSFDALIPPGAEPETVMEGFENSESPLWVGGRNGYLLAADPNSNVIHRWSPKDGQTEFLRPSGYGPPPGPMFREAGSNGMILARGGLVVADSGNRGLAFIDLRTKRKTMLCRDFEGKRFNSPNDLVLGKDGAIYFTDPPWGLKGVQDSPWREMNYTGVFRLAPDNSVTVIDRTVPMPNGIGMAPDGRTLYSTAQRIGWVAWTLDDTGRPSERRTYIDGPAIGVLGGDGFKVDAAGNIWASTREGLSVFNTKGVRIGVIGGRVSNCEFGADGYLYIANGPKVTRIRTGSRKLIF
ncbi:MAG: gluconolactonase [Alphaproteobacteria bacterium PA2]|nr:MAG: gluconolactonase [Alphaproteobacteria bacterium PA2]